MKTRLTFAFALLLICTGTGAALAQTPDDTPPSGETVCDGEAGAAYGLCNAYCEAMDCDSDDAQASETACSKVQSKFQNITGRDVPCEVPPATCPCTSLPYWNQVLAYRTDYCRFQEGGITFGEATGASRISAFTSPENRCSAGFFSNPITLPITPEEAAVCIQLITDIAASRNVTCR